MYAEPMSLCCFTMHEMASSLWVQALRPRRSPTDSSLLLADIRNRRAHVHPQYKLASGRRWKLASWPKEKATLRRQGGTSHHPP